MTPTATATKAKRSRVAAKPIYTNIDQVDDALRKLCDIESRTNARRAKLELKVTELRDKAAEDMADDLANKERFERDIEDYCTYFREDIFDKKKSRVLTHGEINFRQHPLTVKVATKTADVIDKIKEAFGAVTDFITVKESLNKDALKTLPEAELTPLGLKLETKESFGYNLNLEQQN